MGSVKDEDRLISPLFPRLHINDSEKGGPRGPPRNKMALYEQFSVPSQRFSCGSASILDLPSGNESSLVPSMSFSHGCDHERNGLALLDNSLAPFHSTETVFPHSSDGIKSGTAMPNNKKESRNATNDHSLRMQLPLFTTAKHSSSPSQEFSKLKHLPRKKPEDENDFREPSSAHFRASVFYSPIQCNKDQEDRPQLNLSCSRPIQNMLENHKKGSDSIIPKEKADWRNKTHENAKGSQASQDSTERSTSVPLAKCKTSVDSPSTPAGTVESTELLKRAHPSSDQYYPNVSVSVLKSSHGTNAHLIQKCVKTKDKPLPIGKENAFKLRSESYTRPLPEDDNRNYSGDENGSKYCGDKKSIQFQAEHVERLDDVLENSVVESITALNVTPDHVVGVMGEKQFWNARRAIVNQQRLFAKQVFELHRLIKVQKSIAGSPHLLRQDDIHLGKASLKVSPVRKLPFEYAREQPFLIPKPKVQSPKPHPIAKLADENAVTHAAVINEASKGLTIPRSNHRSHSGSAAAAANTKPTPWCFPLPGNQWLVAVMSPSEGLIYKPYAGPCPPTAGFMAPVYGACAPMSTPASGDFLNAAYGVPTSHQDRIQIVSGTPSLGQTYFSAYGSPCINASISGSSVEQISAFSRAHSKDNDLSVGNINLVLPNQSSLNMSSQACRVICAAKYQASKGSDVQGSTASSPSEKAVGNELPLFPTEPAVRTSYQNAKTNKQYARVIKVVPHNPRSAAASAARIFRSIQEERNSMTSIQ